jgi:hypothetical protein
MDMKMRTTIIAATGLTLLMTAAAFGGETCNVPEAEWQPEQALRQKLEADGWKINRIKIDEGCYEVYGFDGDGKRAETYFDPKTFEVVKEG